MAYAIHLFFILFVVLIYLLFRNGFFSKHPVFLLYLTFVMTHNVFFMYIGPALGFHYGLSWYYTLSCLVIDGDHVLKIAVAFALFHHLLNRFEQLRDLLDRFLTLTVFTLSICFLLRFNPAGTFLYNTTIYFGKWTFLLLATTCVLILVIVRFSGVRTEKSYRLIVQGFLVYSLLQTLNFFYLSVAYDRLAGFWRVLYQTGFFLPLLFWLRAAICPAEEAAAGRMPIAGRMPASDPFPEEVVGIMRRFDDLAGRAFQKRLP